MSNITIGDDGKELLHLGHTHRRDKTKLGYVGTHGVDRHGALAHQQLPRPVHHQDGLLLDALDRDETHARPFHCLTDGGCVRCVVLAPLHIGLHVVRRHQLDLKAQPRQLPRPVVRRGTGLHADETGAKLLKERQHLRPARLLPDDNFPLGTDAVHLKHVLGKIKTDRGNFALRAAPIPRGSCKSQPWHNRCRRVGAVLCITSEP